LYPIYVKLWFTKSVSTFASVETEEPAPVMKSESFFIPENAPTRPFTIPKYVKGWARRGRAKKKETKNLFIEGYYKVAMRIISLNNVFPNSKASSVCPYKFKFCPLGRIY
jgi:hypothetical protein